MRSFMDYDIFFSYLWDDNINGHVTEFIGHIRKDSESFAGREMRVFFDLQRCSPSDGK